MNYSSPTNEYYWRDDIPENCTLLWRLSEYTSTYGFLGTQRYRNRIHLPQQYQRHNTGTLFKHIGEFRTKPTFVLRGGLVRQELRMEQHAFWDRLEGEWQDAFC